MDNKQIQADIQKQFRQHQEKLVYYLLALSVSAIGFSIYQTTGKPLSLIKIPLGLAVLSWSLSIFCGLKFMKYVISSLYANNEYFKIISGKNEDIGNHPEGIKIGIKAYKEAMVINATRMEKLFKYLNILFYCGIIFFIIWHVLEMSIINCCTNH